MKVSSDEVCKSEQTIVLAFFVERNVLTRALDTAQFVNIKS
jgi:hypothetical protein